LRSGKDHKRRRELHVSPRNERTTVVLLFTAWLPLCLWAGGTFAQTKTTNYIYDALGRLTFVQDPLNGNRDYDYDRAGNRVIVAVGEATDGAVEPGAPPMPTGLTKLQVADCAWRGTWNASAGAANYKVGDTTGVERTVTTLYIFISCPTGHPEAVQPKWVQACNQVGCSVKAQF
jgi:YD repeat-containing protein